jgi:MoaA/NifB/PqqE/SkfB family radical SAM enzyme
MKKFETDIDQTLPTFCAIPFVSMVVNTDAALTPCCMMNRESRKLRNSEGRSLNVTDPLKEAWNSNDLKQIRTNMISGNKVKGCEVCYLQESSGRISNRQHANSEWSTKLGEEHLYELIDQAILKNGELDYKLAYLDLRLGNLCNLKCRMCSPYNSSQILKEHLELEQKDLGYKVVWAKTFGKLNPDIEKVQDWFDRDFLWDQIIDMIPHLHKVYMTGGEPTLIQNNFKFMQACLDQGRQDMLLFFNTNCTNVNAKFTNLISQFKRVNINASIDGTGIVNEYIRAPSKWNQISTNVEKLASMPNVVLGITPTVQVYNIFNLVDTLKWVDSLNQKYHTNIFVDFLINVHPKHLAVGILPDHIRHRVAEDLIAYKNQYFNRYTHNLTIDSVNGIIGLLQKPRHDDWQEQWNRFKIYTESLDKERNQNLADASQILSDLLNEQ